MWFRQKDLSFTEQKKGDKLKLFPEKRLEKRKIIRHSCQINIPVNGLCYKRGVLIRQFYRNFFICLKIIIMQLRKSKQWVHNSVITHNSTVRGSFSYT